MIVLLTDFGQTEYVGVIGAMSGEAISSKNYHSLTLEYPIESALAKYPDYYLYSNILWNERMNLDLSVNKSITGAVTFSLINPLGMLTLTVSPAGT